MKLVAACVWMGLVAGGVGAAKAQVAYLPGHRVIADSHNCYPYGEWWSDRIDRALAGGVPVAIEQDLFWYRPNPAKPGKSLLAHSGPLNGHEPGMEAYFFERIRPIVEAALKNPDHSAWPIITLNLDIKTEEPEHLREIRALLEKYQPWLTTAERTNTPEKAEPLTVGPILVLNGPSDVQQMVFYDEVKVGARLVTFGAVHSDAKDRTAPAAAVETETRSNYRRWWNNSWTIIEPEGQPKAGEWTAAKAARLKAFVDQAHARNLWIRFYTLDGATKAEESAGGWFSGYNFPSLDAARIRWVASMDAGVDYIASDQYELVSAMVKAKR